MNQELIATFTRFSSIHQSSYPSFEIQTHVFDYLVISPLGYIIGISREYIYNIKIIPPNPENPCFYKCTPFYSATLVKDLVAIFVVFYLQLTSSPLENFFSCAFDLYPDSDHFSSSAYHPQTKKPSCLSQTILMTSFLSGSLLPLSHFYYTHGSQINYLKSKSKTWQSSLNALMTFHCIKNKIQWLDFYLQDSTLFGHWLYLQTHCVDPLPPCLVHQPPRYSLNRPSSCLS